MMMLNATTNMDQRMMKQKLYVCFGNNDTKRNRKKNSTSSECNKVRNRSTKLLQLERMSDIYTLGVNEMKQTIELAPKDRLIQQRGRPARHQASQRNGVGEHHLRFQNKAERARWRYKRERWNIQSETRNYAQTVSLRASVRQAALRSLSTTDSSNTWAQISQTRALTSGRKQVICVCRCACKFCGLVHCAAPTCI